MSVKQNQSSYLYQEPQPPAERKTLLFGFDIGNIHNQINSAIDNLYKPNKDEVK